MQVILGPTEEEGLMGVSVCVLVIYRCVETNETDLYHITTITVIDFTVMTDALVPLVSVVYDAAY